MSQALVPSPSGPPRSNGAPPSDAPKAGENPLLMLHKLLRGRYWLAGLLAAILAPCGAAVGYFAVQLEYSSSSTIRIVPMLPKVLFETEQNNIMPMFDSFLQTQVSLVQSRRVIEMAMQSESWREAGGEYSLEALEEFTKSLSVVQPRSSQLMLVQSTDKDPNRARAATKAVVDAYMEIYGGTDLSNKSETFEFLEQRRKTLDAQIKGLNEEILTVANEFGSDDLSGPYAFELNNSQALKSELEAARLQLAAIKPETTEESADGEQDFSKLTVDEIAALDGRMQGLLDERKRIEREIGDFEATLRRPEVRPEYRRATEALKAQDEDIEAYAELFRQNSLRGGGTDIPGAFPQMMGVQQLTTKVNSLTALYEEARVRTLDLGKKNLQLKQLRADLARVQDDLNFTNTRYEQLSVESSSNGNGRITVLNVAETPTSPSNSKRRMQLVILGGLGSAGLGVGLVLLLGFFNPRIRDIEDAQDIRPRLLGALPLLPESLTDLAEVLAAAQCVHRIRTLLHAHMPPNETLSLTITAPNSSAGKTSFALSLGLSFASSGTRTLIIDGDMVGTGLTRYTGAAGRCKLGHVLRRFNIITEEESRHALNLARQSGRPIGHSLLELGYISEMDLSDGLSIQEDAGLGFADALNGEHFEDCLADIGVPNLSILPASRNTGAPTHSISPDAVRNLLDKLRASFDVILIDAGPTPGTTDATIMATCADGVIMVTSRGDQGSGVQRALKHLQELNVSVVGLVFNRAKPQDIERSKYSSSVSGSYSNSPSKVELDDIPSYDLTELLEPVSDVGPLPQAVWLSTMHPKVFKSTGVPV